MIKKLSSLLFLFIGLTVFGQEPTDQDCLGAIAVCQDTYYQPNSYSGTGNYPNEIPTGGGCPGNCMLNGEKNDVWYIFTVQTAGNVAFTISPNNQADDYDWAVYSLNEYKCQDIISHVNEMQVSCNWSGTPGDTGPNGFGSLDCQGANGTKFNKVIPVLAGETYVVNISNFSSTQYGYLLDFTASTASIYDDVAPLLWKVFGSGLQCGSTQLSFEFTEKILCATTQYQDFKLEGPGGPYTILSLFGEDCEIGGQMEKVFTITFEPPLFQSGQYSLSVLPLSFIQDNCGNMSPPHTKTFNLNLSSPVANAGPDQEITFMASTLIDASVTGGSGNYNYDWQPEDKLVDPGVEDPTTVSLTESVEYTMNVTDNSTGCITNDKVTITIVGGEMSITTTATPDALCAGEPSELKATPSGGSGEYTYTWTSNPPGFTSDLSSPTVYPTETTTYYVEVSDGFSTINAETTVVVRPNPVADAGPDQVINIGTVTTLSGAASEGDGPYDFEWNPAAKIDGPSDIPNPTTVVLMAPQNYTLIVTDNNGCVSEPNAVLINATGDGLAAYPQSDPYQVCIGGSVTLQANATGGGGSYTYTWTSTEPGWTATGDNIMVTPSVTTTYFVEVNDGFTTSTAHVIVPVLSLPEINLIPPGYVQIGQDTIVACVKDTVLLDAGNDTNPPDMEYLWSNAWGERYMIAKTNGNWFDIQSFSVEVTNSVTSCQNSSEITVLFDFNQCEIGVEEKPTIYRPVTVHPNPNTGRFYIQSEIAVKELEIVLLTLQGSPVLEEKFTKVSGNGWESLLDISHLSNGVYLLWLNVDGQTYFQKVVKN